MKKVFTILLGTLFTVSVFAQSPEKMSYQAVIRTSGTTLVTNTQVAMQISILQGSSTGTSVYTETQTPTTNENGLVSIKIGEGTLVSGNFSAIDWADGPFYIKSETDPDGSTGGITYTIEGTSQLLSVPYALYAKTAGSTSGTGGHYVGELYGGGVVYWVDNTGQHGLILSMIDLGDAAGLGWSNMPNSVGVTNDWDGPGNTALIIGQAGFTDGAAKLCTDYTNADYGTGTFDDWYLPSRGELNTVWNNLYELQKALISDGKAETTALVQKNYWSSTQSNSTDAWTFAFTVGYPATKVKTTLNPVRAARDF